ncbi:potassium channel protein [Candidatus Bathyarchaeota archaeon]|nr:potassium channel protein [Candidatus Bathyarchaeota archaeon]
MTHLEKIRYKPISVKKILREMKDISEVMIDLAYSAALFNNADLAREVMELEERVDTLSYLLNMNAMIAARDAGDAEALISILTVAAATNEISDAAADIAKLVLLEIGIHPIVREAFRRIEEQLIRVVVKPGSTLINKKIGDLDLAAQIGVDIIAIRRVKKWIIDPKDDEVIRENDVLIARGAPMGIEKLRAMAEGKEVVIEE